MPEQRKAPDVKAPTDWEAIRVRLAHSVSLLGNSGELNPAQEREVLVRRAAALAQPVGAVAALAEVIQVVAFELGGQVFGFDGDCVRETVSPREVTRLPGLPPSVSGLVNIRSRVVPAFDLRPLLNLPSPSAADAQRLLVVTHEGADFAVLADRVVGSRPLSPAALRGDVPGLNTTYVRGITDDGLVLLDLAALAADLELDDAGD